MLHRLFQRAGRPNSVARITARPSHSCINVRSSFSALRLSPNSPAMVNVTGAMVNVHSPQFQAMQFATKLSGHEYRTALKQQQPFIDEIKSAQESADAEKAISVVRGMVQQKITPLNDVYQLVVDTCISANKFDSAMEIVFTDMRQVNVEPDVSVWNSLIRGSKSKNDPIQAEKIFHKMLLEHGFLPDIQSFNSLLEVYVAAGDPAVYDKFSHMSRFGVADERSALIIEEAKKTIPIPADSVYNHFEHFTRNLRGVNLISEVEDHFYESAKAAGLTDLIEQDEQNESDEPDV